MIISSDYMLLEIEHSADGVGKTHRWHVDNEASGSRPIHQRLLFAVALSPNANESPAERTPLNRRFSDKWLHSKRRFCCACQVDIRAPPRALSGVNHTCPS